MALVGVVQDEASWAPSAAMGEQEAADLRAEHRWELFACPGSPWVLSWRGGKVRILHANESSGRWD